MPGCRAINTAAPSASFEAAFAIACESPVPSSCRDHCRSIHARPSAGVNVAGTVVPFGMSGSWVASSTHRGHLAPTYAARRRRRSVAGPDTRAAAIDPASDESTSNFCPFAATCSTMERTKKLRNAIGRASSGFSRTAGRRRTRLARLACRDSASTNLRARDEAFAAMGCGCGRRDRSA